MVVGEHVLSVHRQRHPQPGVMGVDIPQKAHLASRLAHALTSPVPQKPSDNETHLRPSLHSRHRAVDICLAGHVHHLPVRLHRHRHHRRATGRHYPVGTQRDSAYRPGTVTIPRTIHVNEKNSHFLGGFKNNTYLCTVIMKKRR